DGNVCNGAETCDGNNRCASGTPPTCNDSDPCTDDTCVPGTGCTFTANTAPCDDANACTYDDTCNGSGQCVGTAITCTSDTCNARSCNGTSSCTVTPNTGASCDDGNACSYNDTCNGSGQCVGTAITCTSDTCNARSCNGTSSCTVTPNTGASCDDANTCTYNDTCNGSGQCVGTAITCTSDTCNTRTCNGTSSCTVTPITGTSCDDGNACTANEAGRRGGQCVGTALTCTSDQCNTRTCNGTASRTVTPNTAAGCDDGNVCRFDDSGDGGGQCVGTAITCTSDQCNTRTCNGTASCTVTPNTGAACDDGNACTA